MVLEPALASVVAALVMPAVHLHCARLKKVLEIPVLKIRGVPSEYRFQSVLTKTKALTPLSLHPSRA